jgi:hypothetical protein
MLTRWTNELAVDPRAEISNRYHFIHHPRAKITIFLPALQVGKVEKVEKGKGKVDHGNKSPAGGIHTLYGEKEKAQPIQRNLTDQSSHFSRLRNTHTHAKTCGKHLNAHDRTAVNIMENR